MYTETISVLSETKLNIWKDFLRKASLEADDSVTQIVFLWDGDTLVATGARTKNILKCIAVDPARQGEGLTATVITHLRQEAFKDGFNHLFLYTKPQNKEMFSSLFFYPVAQTDNVLLMENQRDGIKDFLNGFSVNQKGGVIGSVVMNCNPFTIGHRYIIETAAKECDHLYVFVVSEDESLFSADDRFKMVQSGTEDISNVTVLPTGPYLISSATFPTYFLKGTEKVQSVQCLLDIEIFSRYFAPYFSITRRYVGSEPFCSTTNQYNQKLQKHLPEKGIELIEIPRIEYDRTPVSASFVRKLITDKNTALLKNLVPDTTFNYLKHIDMI